METHRVLFFDIWQVFRRCLHSSAWSLKFPLLSQRLSYLHHQNSSWLCFINWKNIFIVGKRVERVVTEEFFSDMNTTTAQECWAIKQQPELTRFDMNTMIEVKWASERETKWRQLTTNCFACDIFFNFSAQLTLWWTQLHRCDSWKVQKETWSSSSLHGSEFFFSFVLSQLTYNFRSIYDHKIQICSYAAR